MKIPDLLLCGSGTIDELPLEMAINDFDPKDGVLHLTYGEQLVESVERSIHRGIPLLTVNTSPGMCDKGQGYRLDAIVAKHCSNRA